MIRMSLFIVRVLDRRSVALNVARDVVRRRADLAKGGFGDVRARLGLGHRVCLAGEWRGMCACLRTKGNPDAGCWVSWL